MIIRTVPSQLPMWPDAVRGGPNVLLRSAFFAGIKSGKRQTLGTQLSPDREPEGVEIASQDGQTIRYAGTQLNQYDADVFFEVLHRSRRSPLGTEAFFTGASFLSSIGRSRNNLNYEDLDNSLRRLKRGTVDVSWRINGKPYTFTGSLIDTVTRETDSKLYRVTLSPEVRVLFSPASWTQIEWQERKKLSGKPLAQWLHSFYCTHAKPFPLSVQYLKEKTGSPTKLLKHFKVELSAALKSLNELVGWDCEIDGDLVRVNKTATDSQTRHIARSETRRRHKAETDKVVFGPRWNTRLPSPTPQARESSRDKGLTNAQDTLVGLLSRRRLEN